MRFRCVRRSRYIVTLVGLALNGAMWAPPSKGQRQDNDPVISTIDLQYTTVGRALQLFADRLRIKLTIDEAVRRHEDCQASFIMRDGTWSQAFNSFLVSHQLTLVKTGAREYEVRQVAK